MKSTLPNANTTPTAGFLALFTLLVMVAGLSVGCSTLQDNRGGSSPAPASPGTSPQPSASPTREDTIIVIKGGSVDLDFDEMKYVSNGNTKPKYVCSRCTFTSLDIKDGSLTTSTTFSLKNYPIKIEAGGGNKDMHIRELGTGGIEIEFDKDQYKDGVNPGGVQRKHYNPNNVLRQVAITPSLRYRCPGGKCEIMIHAAY